MHEDPIVSPTDSTLYTVPDGIIDLSLDWDLLAAPAGAANAPTTEDLTDWMMHSLAMYGRVDIIYIASELHIEYAEVIAGLQGHIYQNPETWEQTLHKGWEPADVYLSGNLRHKLKIATDAALEYPGQFDANVRALTNVMPEMVRRGDIFITLGSPWVPTEIIDAFVFELIGDPPCRKGETRADFKIRHDTITGTWEIPYKSRYGRPEYQVQMTNTYGTSRMDALHILERTLNMQTPTIKDDVPDPARPGKYHRVTNREETILACEMQQVQIEKFREWVWKDPERRAILEDRFDHQYGCVLPRRFDGSFLRFPGMSPSVHLFAHQKNAVARILLSPNTLLAHDVGAGKTFVMIAAGMELRRMGISKKNLYVLPNTLIGQWESLFYTLYPNAKLLTVDRRNFTPKRREATLTLMRDGDFDAILISYGAFAAIPLSRTYYEREIVLEQETVAAALAGENATETLARKKQSLARKLEELLHPELKEEKKQKKKGEADLPLIPLDSKDLTDVVDDENGEMMPILSADTSSDTEDATPPSTEEQLLTDTAPVVVTETVASICFDDLGIGTLFVDEAHNFKNLPLETKVEHVHGISADGSARCSDMLHKVRCVQRANSGRGVVMATGTPITNSITDVFVLQTYLQSGELSLLDLQNFDSWIGMFAERAMEFEVDIDTNNFRLVSRFSKFHNLSVLTTLLSYIADFHALDASDGLPAFEGYDDVTIARTPAFSDFLREISVRAESLRSGEVSRFVDNMLKITNDGRKAALDLRLVRPATPFTYQSKLGRCAETVYRIYLSGMEERSAQLVFCDTSTPKKGLFNIYEELKKLLVGMGIPEAEIAFVHDATTDRRRTALFAAVQSGEVRVLIGSTFKLGTGVNVQERLIAIHHLDVPWRPADMVQREGRILRRGNTLAKVSIYRYIMEGSFDAYSWQLLETKQRFISNLLSGSLSEQSAADVANSVLTYAEVKALAVGNPLLRQRIELANDLSRLYLLQRKAEDARMMLEHQRTELPAAIAHRRQLLEFCDADMAFFAENPPRPTGEEREALTDKLAAAVERSLPIDDDVKLFTYRGFGLVLPHGTDRDKPAVFAERAGRYYISLGADERIYLDFVDRFLSDLAAYRGALAVGLSSAKRQLAEVEKELARTETYTEEIAICQEELAKLDKQLGVTQE